MPTTWPIVFGFVLMLVLEACAGTRAPQDVVAPRELTTETTIGMLDTHLIQLTRNIEGLNDRIADLKNMPDTPDPTVRELRALDVAGWELHEQQWVMQREHLSFARTQLMRVTESPGDKTQLLQEWSKHEEAFETAMEDFRRQRHALEQKRVQVEAQFIERFLR